MYYSSKRHKYINVKNEKPTCLYNPVMRDPRVKDLTVLEDLYTLYTKRRYSSSEREPT